MPSIQQLSDACKSTGQMLQDLMTAAASLCAHICLHTAPRFFSWPQSFSGSHGKGVWHAQRKLTVCTLTIVLRQSPRTHLFVLSTSAVSAVSTRKLKDLSLLAFAATSTSAQSSRCLEPKLQHNVVRRTFAGRASTLCCPSLEGSHKPRALAPLHRATRDLGGQLSLVHNGQCFLWLRYRV